MLLDPRQLECLIAVAEELNFNRAARRLRMTQPPLTRRIAKLERDVGAELFRRTAGGVELTEPGAALLDQAYRLVALSGRAVERARLARSGEVGHLTVGYYDTAILDGIPALLDDFVAAHPGITIDIERVSKASQVDYLHDKILHVGFGRNYPRQKGITSRIVWHEDLFVAHRGLPELADRASLTVDDLRNHSLAVYPKERPGFADEIVNMCLDAGFVPTIAVEAEDVIACLAYVAVTAAIAVLPGSAANIHPRGITFVPLLSSKSMELSCVYLTDHASPTVTLFEKYLDSRSPQSGEPDGPDGNR